MDLRKGDLVVHTRDTASTGRMLFYVEDVNSGDGHPRLAQVSSRMGWGLRLPAAELEVVGHSDHTFTRRGYAFVASEMHHFQDAITEARRRGHQLTDAWVS